MCDSNGEQEAQRRIGQVMRAIRHTMPAIDFNFSEIGAAEVREGLLDGQPIERAVFILRSRGCEWALKGEGCTMCGHFVGTRRGAPIDADLYVRQFERQLEQFDFERLPMLCLYNSGSFLNDAELPAEARTRIFRRIAGIRGIRHLVIESRPEYVTEAVLQELCDILGDKTLEVGMGLETVDDQVRSLCLNKGFDKDDYLRAANAVSRTGARLLAYVLVKPPFLLESEAIEDAARTVAYAFDNGARAVSLEPVSVQDYTLIQYLYEAGYYRSPWIWSIFDVVRKTHGLGEIRIGGFKFLPVPKIFTHNCPLCDALCLKEIFAYNTGAGVLGLNALHCSCQEAWRRDTQMTDPRPLSQRVCRTLRDINQRHVLEQIRKATTLRTGAAPLAAESGTEETGACRPQRPSPIGTGVPQGRLRIFEQPAVHRDERLPIETRSRLPRRRGRLTLRHQAVPV